MEQNETFEFNTEVLDRLVRALKNIPTARVGILGNKDARQGPSNSNATVGAAHEFGTSRLPMRSFLRMPVNTKLNAELEKSKAFDEAVLKEVISSGSAKAWMELVAKAGEAVVIDAFNTNGFGQWKAHAPGYSNNTGSILVDTQQLKRSITSDVK